MKIPQKLLDTLKKLSLDGKIYEERSRKCVLSKEYLGMEVVPWCENAYFIPEGLEKENNFVFDPVSLVPCLALQPEKNDRILDMCAAPGTKTHILSFLTENEADITANDIDARRIMRLRYNAKKFGIKCRIINESGRKIQGSYNKILVDVPCSGSGMVNKKEKLFRHWNSRRVKILAKKQKKLVEHAFEILEKNGILVYSTCTFQPEENEAVVNHLLDKFSDSRIEEMNVNVNHAKGITEWDDRRFKEEIQKCIRIYPQHNKTGGFFVAKIRKRI